MDNKSNQPALSVSLSIPVTHPGLFSHRATVPLLTLLADNPDTGFGIRELSRATDYTHRSVSLAITDLEAVDLVDIDHHGPKKLVRINRDRLETPHDPILSIPQSAFHEPVRALVDSLESDLEGVRGIILFGSVARGTADRRSDIDCFVLVSENQATGQRTAHQIVDEFHDRRFDGDRYTFQVLVESIESATQYGERLREIVTHGRTLVDSEQLRELKRTVLRNGQ